MKKIIEKSISITSQVLKRYPKLAFTFQRAKLPTLTNYTFFRDDVINPIKIAFLSDIHLGWCTNENIVIETFNLALAQKPDLIILGGDIVEDDARCVNLILPIIKKITMLGIAVYCVRGNHDLRSQFGADKYIFDSLTKSGAKLMVNESITLNVNQNNIRLVFSDDPSRGNPNLVFMHNLNCYYPRIFICHSPDIFGRLNAHNLQSDNIMLGNKSTIKDYNFSDLSTIIDKLNCDFHLFGHTHGGQVKKFGKYVIPKKSYSRLFCYGSKTINQKVFLTTSGVGNSGMPLRIGINPEVLFLTINPK